MLKLAHQLLEVDQRPGVVVSGSVGVPYGGSGAVIVR